MGTSDLGGTPRTSLPAASAPQQGTGNRKVNTADPLQMLFCTALECFLAVLSQAGSSLGLLGGQV